MNTNRRGFIGTLLASFCFPWKSHEPRRAFLIETRGYLFWYSARSEVEALEMHRRIESEPVDEIEDVTNDRPFPIFDEESGTTTTRTLAEWVQRQSGFLATDCF